MWCGLAMLCSTCLTSAFRSQWYKDRFGFITSDEIQLAPDFSLGAFMRCDRGEEPTDHHTLFLMQSPKGPGFNHAAFEGWRFWTT